MKVFNLNLSTSVTREILLKKVLTQNWNTAADLYPVYKKEIGNMPPVIPRNFRHHLEKLVKSGEVERLDESIGERKYNTYYRLVPPYG